MLAKGCLFGLLGVLAGLAAIGAAADIGARHFATSKIEQRIRQQVPEASGVHARILGWPFLKVAANGDVDEIAVRVDQMAERPLVFSDVAVDLRSVHISQSNLVTNARVDVTHIGRGTISLVVTEASLLRALGLPPLPAGAMSQAAFRIDAGSRSIVVTAAGHAVKLALPGANILPCLPTMSQPGNELVLSCTFTSVPSAFTSLSA